MSGDYIEVSVVNNLISLDTNTGRDALYVRVTGMEPFTMDIPEPEDGRDWQDTIHDALTAEIQKRQQ